METTKQLQTVGRKFRIYAGFNEINVYFTSASINSRRKVIVRNQMYPSSILETNPVIEELTVALMVLLLKKATGDLIADEKGED